MAGAVRRPDSDQRCPDPNQLSKFRFAKHGKQTAGAIPPPPPVHGPHADPQPAGGGKAPRRERSGKRMRRPSGPRAGLGPGGKDKARPVPRPRQRKGTGRHMDPGRSAHTAPMRASRSASSAVTVEGRARPTAAITARSRFIAGLASDPPCRHVPALSGRAPAGRTGREAGEGRGWGRARLPEREDFQATVGAGVVCIHRNLP